MVNTSTAERHLRRSANGENHRYAFNERTSIVRSITTQACNSDRIERGYFGSDSSKLAQILGMDSMAHRNRRVGLVLVKRKARSGRKFNIRARGMCFTAGGADRRCGGAVSPAQRLSHR